MSPHRPSTRLPHSASALLFGAAWWAIASGAGAQAAAERSPATDAPPAADEDAGGDAPPPDGAPTRTAVAKPEVATGHRSLIEAARMQSSTGPSEATMAASTAHLAPATDGSEFTVPSIEDEHHHRRRPSGSEQRHEGFFLRLVAGAGAGTAAYQEHVDGARSDVQTRGLTGLLELSVGGSVREHLILHGSVLVTGFGDARRTVNNLPDASQKPTTTTSMVGGGASYYFPLNVYVTGSLGVAWFDESRSNTDEFRTGTGVGLCLATGKEWWVGSTGEWGIGAALRGGLTAGPATLAGYDTRVRTGHFAIAVSATLN